MKKYLCIIVISVLLLTTNGCKGINNTYPDFKVINNGISFVCKIEHKRTNSYQSGLTFIVDKLKEDFFNELENNQYYIERFNDNTLVFFKKIEQLSSYFVIEYNANNGSYCCLSANIGINGDKNIEIDFPYFVLDETSIELTKDCKINCDFDYLKAFYQKMPEITVEQSEDYITIKTYNEYTFEENNICIEKINTDTISFTII